jgi:CrcB protein
MNGLFSVMLGGAIGAGARHLVGRGVLALVGPGFPWATMAINIAGGLLMGLLAGGLLRLGTQGEAWRLFLGVGMLGGFTTFSSFSLDAVALAQRGEVAAATAYVLVSVAGSIAALYGGLTLARSIWGQPA